MDFNNYNSLQTNKRKENITNCFPKNIFCLLFLLPSFIHHYYNTYFSYCQPTISIKAFIASSNFG